VCHLRLFLSQAPEAAKTTGQKDQRIQNPSFQAGLRLQTPVTCRKAFLSQTVISDVLHSYVSGSCREGATTVSLMRCVKPPATRISRVPCSGGIWVICLAGAHRKVGRMTFIQQARLHGSVLGTDRQVCSVQEPLCSGLASKRSCRDDLLKQGPHRQASGPVTPEKIARGRCAVGCRSRTTALIAFWFPHAAGISQRSPNVLDLWWVEPGWRRYRKCCDAAAVPARRFVEPIDLIVGRARDPSTTSAPRCQACGFAGSTQGRVLYGAIGKALWHGATDNRCDCKVHSREAGWNQ